MRQTLLPVLSLIGLLLTSACDNAPEADLIFWGGPIYTAVDKRPMVEVVAIKDGRIIYAGDVGKGRSYAGPQTVLIELKNAALFPGFADAHVHLRGVGERALSLDLASAASPFDVSVALEDWIWDHPEAQVVTGRGWIETHWPEKRFPTRFDIDAVSRDMPVLLVRGDGHALLANTAALKLAGIDRETSAPEGGEILTFADGEPTGMLIDAAMQLVAPILPERDLTQVMFAYQRAFEIYSQRGWVHAQNMSVGLEEVELLENLSQLGRNPLKIYNAVRMDDAGGLVGTGESRSLDGLVRTRAVKLYIDGALGSRGAALLEPYLDHPSTGLILLRKEEVMPILEQCLRYGIQVATHAIGDRGNRTILDWYEEAFANVPPSERLLRDPRWRIEHAQVLAPEDMDRMAKMNIIASMQPSHAISDLHFAPDRLGDDRLGGAYAWRSLLDRGVMIAAGSDAPVEEGDPLIEFYAAVTRKDLGGFSAPNWHPEETVTRQEALKMLTIWPAFAAFAEDETGSLEVGKAADLTVLDRDIMMLPEMEIPKARVLMTMRDGQIIYEAEESGLKRERPLAEE